MPVAFAMADHAPSLDGRTAAAHIRLPAHRGGCGNEHEVQVDDRGHAFIDCARCGPGMVATHYGWSASPGGVPLTPDQIAANDLAKRDAEVGQNAMMRAMTDSFVKAVQGGGFTFPGIPGPVPQKSLVEQIAEMSDGDKAALAAMLAPAAPVQDAAPGTSRLVQSADAPAKRGPGRPRTVR